MAEAEILLQTIEQIDTFLIEKANVTNIEVQRMRYQHELFENMEVVERVRNELSLFLDFLVDNKLEEGSSLKYWMSDVVEIVHDAQYFMDDRYPFFHGYLGDLFKPICRALIETRNRILQLGVKQTNRSTIASASQQEGLDENVVGLEQEMEYVFRKSILCDSTDLNIMCIVGMAGVGKTTLARKIYNHPTTVSRYELRIWVSISRKMSNKEVLMKLILQVLHNKDQSVLLAEMENADNKSLQQMLHQQLQGKNFLIVFDNIEKIRYFRSFEKAIPGKVKSRLLLTSRFRSVEYILPFSVDVFSLQIKPLDDDRSWQLFLKLLHFSHLEFPRQLEVKGKEMLRGCDGLPLSIKEVAEQFVIKRQSGSEWEELIESIDLSETLAVLESVYQKWPPRLKSCFLCLSFFAKGTTIRREKLIQVWTAGQVIPQEEEDQDLEKIKFYLDFLDEYKTTLVKLRDECIIEVDLSKNLRIKYVRVNASFHTLSMVKAEEEMVFETLKKGKGNPSSMEPRHRAIYCSRDECNHVMDHDKHLVSLFFRGGGYFDSSEPYWKRFQQLRTLDFEGFGLKMLPDTIGVLIELRYLGLRDNYLQMLPQSLGGLKNLEVLDLALNFRLEVPDIIWKIGSLRHLYMSSIICREPLKIDTLKNLETWTYISVDNCTLSSLEMMTSLCKLGIEEVDERSDVSKLFASLAYLRNLNCLILRGFLFRSLPSLHGLETLDNLTEIRLDGLITKLPSADIFPPRITQLSLINSSLDEDPMPELGKLENLSYLKLKNAYTGQQMIIPGETFYYLEVLRVEELWHLRNIQAVEALPRLHKLEIKSCPYLENIPKNIIPFKMKALKMLTTRKLAAKIRRSDVISKIEHVDIQPRKGVSNINLETLVGFEDIISGFKFSDWLNPGEKAKLHYDDDDDDDENDDDDDEEDIILDDPYDHVDDDESVDVCDEKETRASRGRLVLVILCVAFWYWAFRGF